MTRSGGSTIAALFAEIVGRDHVVTDPDQLKPYETDWTGRFTGSTPAVVRPGSLDEVVAIVALCRRDGICLVAQGGNTGLVGGGVPLGGEIVLSLRRLDSVGDVDSDSRQITAGAGVTISAVQAAADQAGLAYAVDLAARDSATVGGTIATNAGGINVLRYGGTREQVIGVEAVLGTGAVISRMHGLIKDNTGYHWPSLMCGSEGTLGIVTAARLQLVARHNHHTTALIGMTSFEAATTAVAAVRSALDSLSAAEFMLDSGLRLVCETFDLAAPFSTPAPVYILLEAADHRDPTDELAEAVASLDGVLGVAVAGDRARRAALWRFREDHTLAINTLGPPHKLDVTLPASRLAEFVATVPAVVADVMASARTWLFGHIGDGNVHVNITGLDPHDERADDAVLRHVSSMQGSISAEHGIGTAKLTWLHLNRAAADLEAMRTIKHALDPANILNPNALLPRRAV